MTYAIVGCETQKARDVKHGAEGECIYCGMPVKAINRVADTNSRLYTVDDERADLWRTVRSHIDVEELHRT